MPGGSAFIFSKQAGLLERYYLLVRGIIKYLAEINHVFCLSRESSCPVIINER